MGQYTAPIKAGNQVQNNPYICHSQTTKSKLTNNYNYLFAYIKKKQ